MLTNAKLGTVIGDVVKNADTLLNDRSLVDFLSRKGGLKLIKGMSPAEKQRAAGVTAPPRCFSPIFCVCRTRGQPFQSTS